MAGVQVTVDIPAEQLAKASENLFDNLDEKTRAEIVAKAVTEVLKSPDMIRRDVEKEAEARGLRRDSYVWRQWVDRGVYDIRQPILETCYRKAMEQVYEDLQESIMKSSELKKLMQVVTEHMTNNIREIVIATMTQAMVKQMQSTLSNIETLNNGMWGGQAELNEIKNKLQLLGQ